MKPFLSAITVVGILLSAGVIHPESDSILGNLMDGMARYSAGEKLKTRFIQLCQENKTAYINGRIDTGGGLYMAGDVTVYKEPAKLKTTELADKTLVVLTGAAAEADDKDWVKIKFLYVSTYTETAVDIEEGWVEKRQLRDNP
jgi:hypothetical protein